MKRDLLLYGGDLFRLNPPSSEKIRSDSALEQQAFSGHLHQDETNQLAQVHAADHLFKSTR